MKNQNIIEYYEEIPIIFGLEGVLKPGRWRIFEKINENSNEKFKKF